MTWRVSNDEYLTCCPPLVSSLSEPPSQSRASPPVFWYFWAQQRWESAWPEVPRLPWWSAGPGWLSRETQRGRPRSDQGRREGRTWSSSPPPPPVWPRQIWTKSLSLSWSYMLSSSRCPSTSSTAHFIQSFWWVCWTVFWVTAVCLLSLPTLGTPYTSGWSCPKRARTPPLVGRPETETSLTCRRPESWPCQTKL